MSPLASALELFGVILTESNRIQLREAINKSGAEIIREAGDDNWFDIYNMNANFKESQQLFVGYDKNTAAFAFAEYQMKYHYLPKMLQRMQAKYGKARKKYGTFESDTRYTWQVNGIDIELSYDWNNNVSRLMYKQANNLQALQQAYRQDLRNKNLEKLNIDASYF